LTAPYALPAVTGIGFGTATITASAVGLTSGTQTVIVSARLFGPPTQSIPAGTSQNVSFSLSGSAPTLISLFVSSDNPAVASVPATVSIAPGATGIDVPVSALALGSTTIHISSPPNIPDASVSINVFSAGTISVPAVSLALSQSLPFPISLAAPAPSGGVAVQLTSSDSNVVAIAPAIVFIPAGQTTPLTAPEVGGLNIGVATITAAAPGYLTAGRQVPVTASISMSPQNLQLPVGGSQVLALALSAAAPSIGVPVTPDRAANGFVNGLTVQLSSSNPAVAAVQPSVQFYSDGSSITTVVVVVTGITAGTAVIHAGAPPFIPDATATVVVGSGGSTPVLLRVVSGDSQSAQVGSPFGLPLAVMAVDASTNPVTGVTVTFSAPGSGAGATFGAGNTAVTDSRGIAQVQNISANAAAGTYQVVASAAGVPASATFTLTNLPAAVQSIGMPSNVMVGPNQSLGFPVTLSAPAPAGGLQVTLTSSDPGKATIAPSPVFIPAGSKIPNTQPTITGINFGSSVIGASAPGFVSASQLLQVGASLSFSPASVTISGAVSQSVSLSLSSPAPAGGLTVSLSSSNPAVASVPPSVFIPANVAAVNVSITGVSSGNTVINAGSSAPNVTGTSANVAVNSGSDITITAGVVIGPGESAKLPVFLSRPARSGGVTVSLVSSNASTVTITPDNLYFPEGATGPLSQPQVSGISIGSATIAASSYGLVGATQTVQVSGRLSGPQSQTLQQGATSSAAFVLSWPLTSSVALSVSSDTPSVAAVPSTVTIPAGNATAVVPVQAVGPGTAVIHIGAPPAIGETTMTVTVLAQGTLTLSSLVSVALGQSAAFPLALGTPAPAGGLTVTLSSSDSSIVSISPTALFFPPGSTTAPTQAVVAGNNIGVATITASAPGYLSASSQAAVTATITPSPASMIIPAGSRGLLSMMLSAPAPSIGVPVSPDRAANGFVESLTVNLSSSNPSVASIQPSVQFYSDGSSVTTVVVVVNGLTPGTAVIHAGAAPSIPDVTIAVTVQ